VRSVCGHRVGEIAGAGARDGGEPVLASPGRGDAHHAVLERAGRILCVVLQVQIAQAELGAQVVGADQRRESLTKRDRLRVLEVDGEEIAISPDARRPGLDAFARDVTRNLRVVVADLERSEAVLADVGCLDGSLVTARTAHETFDVGSGWSTSVTLEQADCGHKKTSRDS